jgi:LEA14-like dessication related protein
MIRLLGFGVATVLALAVSWSAPAQALLTPRVTLDGVRVTRLDANDTRFTLFVTVENPNEHDLDIDALEARLAIEGEPLVAGTLNAPVTIAAQAATPVAIDARTTLPAFLAAFDRFTRLPKVRYELTGKAYVFGGVPLPFARSGDIAPAELFAPRR